MPVHTINFSKAVSYTGINTQGGIVEGVSFSKTGASPETITAAHSTDMSTPNKVVAYDVVWTVDPAVGDIVTFDYDSGAVGAAYEDANAVAMATATLSLTNCST